MKKLLLLTLGLFVFANFIACSDDDNDEIVQNTVLKFKRSEDDFRMYVGGKDGGKEVKTKDFKAETFFGKDYANLSVRKEMVYKFENDKKLIISNVPLDQLPSRDTVDYKFTKDTLLVGKKFDFLGIGTKQAFITINGKQLFIKEGVKQEVKSKNQNYSLQELLLAAGFKDLKDMKNEKDTIVWCNVHYFYNNK